MGTLSCGAMRGGGGGGGGGGSGVLETAIVLALAVVFVTMWCTRYLLCTAVCYALGCCLTAW